MAERTVPGKSAGRTRVGGDGSGAGSAATTRRWLVLAAGTAAPTAGSAYQYGLAYLIPGLRAHGLSLLETGVLVACPTIGLLLTLVAWGAAADRYGERLVLTSGLAGAGGLLLAAAGVRDVAGLGVLLGLAGAAGGAVYAASGRLILGWFAARERGLAMGIRQGSQPLGVTLAALALPSLGARGLALPLAVLGGLCLATAVLVVAAVRDPARPGGTAGRRPGSPYREQPLWRIHAASALLIVPQFTVTTFALVFLVDTRHWPAAAGGTVLAAATAAGALSRLAAGFVSDRLGNRLLPMRFLAVSIAAALLALAGLALNASLAAVPVLLIAAVLVVSTNGLAYTAVAERAGPAWAGRALGIHNTGQNIIAAATPPVMAAVIATAGYPAAFAIAGLLPVAAGALVPVAAEHRPAASPSGPP